MTPLAMAAIAAATLLVAGVTLWLALRNRKGRIDDAAEAAAAADAALPGFASVGAVVGADGGGALAVGRDGRVVAMKRLGRRVRAREVAWGALASTPAGVIVDTGDQRLGRVALNQVTALDIRRIAPSYQRP